MRVLYLSQYFPPEVGATQTRAHEMARGLLRAGHDVTMIAEIPNHPTAEAFQKANELAEKARQDAVAYHLETGLLPPEARGALATPLIRHGVKANRKVLETAAQYSFEQGLTPRLIKLEELFAPSVMDQ